MPLLAAACAALAARTRILQIAPARAALGVCASFPARDPAGSAAPHLVRHQEPSTAVGQRLENLINQTARTQSQKQIKNQYGTNCKWLFAERGPARLRMQSSPLLPGGGAPRQARKRVMLAVAATR